MNERGIFGMDFDRSGFFEISPRDARHRRSAAAFLNLKAALRRCKRDERQPWVLLADFIKDLDRLVHTCLRPLSARKPIRLGYTLYLSPKIKNGAGKHMHRCEVVGGEESARWAGLDTYNVSRRQKIYGGLGCVYPIWDVSRKQQQLQLQPSLFCPFGVLRPLLIALSLTFQFLVWS
ncbi:hypothetical protein ACLOJK_033937 [Asimina triloba]